MFVLYCPVINDPCLTPIFSFTSFLKIWSQFFLSHSQVVRASNMIFILEKKGLHSLSYFLLTR